MMTETTMTVLVIEDDEVLRQTTVEVLRLEGYDVIEASDGIDGLGQLQERSFDLVLLDLHLPRLDGIGVLDALEYSPPVVVVSAFEYFDEYTMRERFGAKVVAFLQKPVRPQQLLAVVSSAIADTLSEA
jgi:CheY-like chemotaxis protein